MIAPGWVLTAAHCFELRDKEGLYVVAGTHDLEHGGQRIGVADLIVHAGFNGMPEMRDDIALIELATASAVRPIAIADTSIDSVAPGRLARVTGWGHTKFEGQAQTLLRTADEPIVTNEVCNNPAAWDGGVTASQICAGYGTAAVAPCNGDSGGPLTIEVESVRRLIGIVSFGADCGVPDNYDVYTRVSAYEDWFTSCISKDANGCRRAPPPEAADVQ